MPKPAPKPAPKRDNDEPESTTGLIEALCEISIDTVEMGPQIEAIERRLKTEDL